MRILSKEFTLEVHSIYVSSVYRTQCRTAQFLYLFVYRTNCGGVHYLCQPCLTNSLWNFAVSIVDLLTGLIVKVRSIHVILSTEVTVELRIICVSLCTELTVEMRSA